MSRSEKGMALFLVLSVIMVAAVLAGIVMNFTLNQIELTRHKAQRIKAYYAALAGMNLAFEKIRTNADGWNVTSVHYLGPGLEVSDPDIPYPVTIDVVQQPDGINYNLSITVNYTSTLPSLRGR
ncbi:MAG: hypothetical protein WC559_02130 [Candidatus Omnitrophota bacterium]